MNGTRDFLTEFSHLTTRFDQIVRKKYPPWVFFCWATWSSPGDPFVIHRGRLKRRGAVGGARGEGLVLVMVGLVIENG